MLTHENFMSEVESLVRTLLVSAALTRFTKKCVAIWHPLLDHGQGRHWNGHITPLSQFRLIHITGIDRFVFFQPSRLDKDHVVISYLPLAHLYERLGECYLEKNFS
jgi:long-subunit acyl-CoA synthetase (AMP-forming)